MLASRLVREAQTLAENGRHDAGSRTHTRDTHELEVLVQTQSLDRRCDEQQRYHDKATQRRATQSVCGCPFPCLHKGQQSAQDLWLYKRHNILNDLENGRQGKGGTECIVQGLPEAQLARRLKRATTLERSVRMLRPMVLERVPELLGFFTLGQGPHIGLAKKLASAQRHERLHPMERQATEQVGLLYR